jgi:hypothetical protein
VFTRKKYKFHNLVYWLKSIHFILKQKLELSIFFCHLKSDDKIVLILWIHIFFFRENTAKKLKGSNEISETNFFLLCF